MQTNPASQSGIFNPRLLLAFTLCSVGVMLAMLSLAATSSSGITTSAASSPGDRFFAGKHAGPLTQQASVPCAPLPGPYKCETWASTYDGPAHVTAPGDGYVNSRVMATSPDGRVVYVAGTTLSSSQTDDYIVIAFDTATGAQLWVSLYSGTADLPYAVGYAIAVSPDGSAVFVTGTTTNSGGSSSALVTVAFAADTGVQLWSATLDGGYSIVSPDIATNGTRVFVCGFGTYQDPDASYHFKALTIAYDAATGEQVWLQHDSGNPGAHTFADRIVASLDGSRVYTAAAKSGSDGYTDDILLFTYAAATGDLVQETHHPTVGLPPAGIAIAPDGSHVFVEEANLETGTNNALTLAYDSAGNPVWAARFAGFLPDVFPSTPQPSARPWYNGPITVSADSSRVFLTCLFIELLNEEGFATVSYDAATGNQQWTAKFETYVVDTLVGPLVEANPNGKEVYITGSAANANAATLAYDSATGNQLWLAVYPGGNSNAIAINPDGSRLFVAGSVRATSNLPATAYDLFAVAYDTTTMPLTPTVQLTDVVSRKVHGSAGMFDIDVPQSGPHAIECRSGGPNGDYTMIFSFSNPLTTVGGATTSCGSVSSSAIGPNQNQYTVNLTAENSCNGTYITVTLQDVVDSVGNISSSVSGPPMGLLLGDVNASGLVDGNDVSAVQSHTRQSVNNTNFRYDVNTNGLIDGNDVSITQGQTRTSLP
jgi:hypothetical protein